MKYFAPIIFFFFSLNAVKGQSSKQIYVEIFGNGILFNSVNYDQRFSNSEDGLGFRVGASIIYGRPSDFTFPFMLNYLIGDKHQLEIGGGLVYITGNISFNSGDQLNGIAYTGSIMYRRNYDNGWVFRFGYTPVFDKTSLPIWLGISLGHKF